MSEILLFDTRVQQADTVRGFDLTKMITSHDDLSGKLGELLHDIDSNINTAVPSYFNYFHILCHGTENGLQLGAQGVNSNNVGLFRPLINKVGHVIIHGCSAARVYPNGNNGRLMCQMLARVLNATVTASDSTQFFLPGSSVVNTSNHTSLANWQGNVGQWSGSNTRSEAAPDYVSTQQGRSDGQPLVY